VNQAVFTITDIKDIASSNVALYFSEGLGNGYDSVKSLAFTPTFLWVSPNDIGSQGGTLLTVTGTGFGVNTVKLGLKKGTTALCAEVKVTGYGRFTCLTNAIAVAATDSLSMSQDTKTYTCTNSDTTKCNITQLAASSPTVTAVSLAGDTITFTGTAFPAKTDFTAKATFKSQEVVVTDWAETSLVAKFPKGVPAALASENAVPKIWFTRNSDSVVLVTYSTGVTLTNTVTADASQTTGLESSYAGGLDYTISTANLFATLKEPGNSVTVCGNVCVLNEALSDATKAVCKVPALATTHSASTFKIKEAGLLSGTWSASATDTKQVDKVHDGVWPSEYTDTSANCWIDLTFPD